jgi:hypothetical protein
MKFFPLKNANASLTGLFAFCEEKYLVMAGAQVHHRQRKPRILGSYPT